VEAQVARACQRRAADAAGAPAGASGAQGAPNGAGAMQGAPRQGGGMSAGGGRGGMGGGAMGGGGRGRTGLVFVKSGATYVPRSVRLGASDFDYTQIISGVEEGEEVALLAAAALQAQRNEQNDRMRSRMSVPGMSRTPTTPAGGAPAGGPPGGGPPGGGGGGGGGGRPPGR
jgi:HlyD family secretion protein